MVFIAVLIAVSFAGCQQYPPIPPAGDIFNDVQTNSKPEKARTLIEALNQQLPGHIKTIMEGESVKGLDKVPEQTASTVALMKSLPKASETYTTIFKFTEYEVLDYGFINDGTFTLQYEGTSSTTGNTTTHSFSSQSMSFDNLEVQENNASGIETITIKNLEKEVDVKITINSETQEITGTTGIEEAVDIVQSLKAETSITINNSPVSIKDVAETETASGAFGGGFGTEAFPYIIKDEDQFMKIADYENDMLNGEYLYFDVRKDLNFSGMDNLGITKFRGELDFNNNEIRGISKTQLKAGLITLIDDIIEGKISNLEYRPSEMIPLVYTSGWTSGVTSSQGEWITSFNNVNVYGNFRNISNNSSLYIIQAFEGALEFHDCTSNVFATGDSYDGVFLGGYPQKTTTRLVFDNCVNKGTLITRNAGLFTGNSTYTPIDVIVTDCRNDGQVIGTESSGAYCGLNVNSPAIKDWNDKIEPLLLGSGSIYTKDKTMSVSYSDDKVATITNTSNEATTYKVTGSTYAYMMTSDYKYNGTLMVSFDKEGEFKGAPAEFTYPIRQVVDYKYAANHEGKVGRDENLNDIVTINGTDYYLVTERHPHVNQDITAVITESNSSSKHVIKSLSFSVFSYDKDGIPVGYLSLSN